MAIHRRRGDVYDGAGALVNAGHAAFGQGKLDVAASRYSAALRVIARTGSPDVPAWVLVSVAALAEACEDLWRAGLLLGAANALFEQVEAVRTWPYEDALRTRTLSRLRGTLSSAELENALREGASLSSEQAVAEAVAVADSAAGVGAESTSASAVD